MTFCFNHWLLILILGVAFYWGMFAEWLSGCNGGQSLMDRFTGSLGRLFAPSPPVPETIQYVPVKSPTETLLLRSKLAQLEIELERLKAHKTNNVAPVHTVVLEEEEEEEEEVDDDSECVD